MEERRIELCLVPRAAATFSGRARSTRAAGSADPAAVDVDPGQRKDGCAGAEEVTRRHNPHWWKEMRRDPVMTRGDAVEKIRSGIHGNRRGGSTTMGRCGHGGVRSLKLGKPRRGGMSGSTPAVALGTWATLLDPGQSGGRGWRATASGEEGGWGDKGRPDPVPWDPDDSCRWRERERMV